MIARLTAALLVAAALPAGAQTGRAPVDRRVAVYGQQIHYLEAGSGPPLILLQGLGDAADV